jgi:hypothetical protein
LNTEFTHVLTSVNVVAADRIVAYGFGDATLYLYILLTEGKTYMHGANWY